MTLPASPENHALFVSLLAAVTTVISCSASTFQGQAGQTPAVLNNADEVQFCGPAGETQAALKTPTLENGIAANYLEYQVSLTTCAGDPATLSADRVYFDVDGFDARKDNLPYRVYSGANTVSGHLHLMGGADLFGHHGESYWYYQTDQTIAFASGIAMVTMHIDLLGEKIVPMQGKLSSATQLPTYLRFGQATSATAVVTLIRPEQD